MTTKSKRVVAALLAAAAPTAALALSTTAAQALPAGTAPAGPLTLSTATGNGTAAFNLQFGGPVACPGDSASNGYEWNTFLVSASMDPATLIFAADGSPIAAPGAFAVPLADPGGNNISQQLTNITTGQITSADVSGVSFAGLPANYVPAGSYRIGVACDQLVGPAAGFASGENQKYWSTSITVTSALGGGLGAWSFGSQALTPTAVVATKTGATTANVTFTNPTGSVPAVTGNTVTLTPTNGVGSVVTAPGVAAGTSISGLAIGAIYNVTVSATNGVGAPAVSAPPVVLNMVPGGASVTFTPGTDPTLGTLTVSAAGATSYDVTITPAPTGWTNPTNSTTGSIALTGLTAGTTYAVSVVANFGPGVSVSPTIPLPTFTTGSALAINQVITVQKVELPAVILTQRCGVNAALPAQNEVDAFPGHPALGLFPASANTTGTAPHQGSLTGALDNGTGQFANYPNPDVPYYPTYCGLDLGKAKFVTTGDHLEGQFFAADGALNQVTVLDARNIDGGWTVNGEMSDFNANVSGGTDPDLIFDGNFLGWTPVVTDFSEPLVTGPGGSYAMNVITGNNVEPGKGLGTPTAPATQAQADTQAASAGNIGGGLGATGGQTLAHSLLPTTATQGGLGIATLDARIKLLIPVTKNSGTYNGTLHLTVI